MRRLLTALVLALLLGAPVTAMAQAPPQDQGTEKQDFVSVDPEKSKHRENLSGIPFMVGAYAVIWVGLFGFLVHLRRRQAKVMDEVSHLRGLLEAHDKRQGSEKAT